MGAFLTWLGAFLLPFSPTIAALIARKAVPDPPKPGPNTMNDGDQAARKTAAERAKTGP